MKNKYKYNVMLRGWIIIKINWSFIFSKYQFYYLTYNILKMNIKLELIYNYEIKYLYIKYTY